MTAVFRELRLKWQGHDYLIPSDRIVPAIAIVENHLTFDELFAFFRRSATPLAKLSLVYADLLTFAGAKGVTAGDIYARMFGGGSATQRDVEVVVQYLLERMMPATAGVEFPEAPDQGKGRAGAGR